MMMVAAEKRCFPAAAIKDAPRTFSGSGKHYRRVKEYKRKTKWHTAIFNLSVTA
ncbi:hypothetical protein [Lelliottia aquatilis]|uniref:hypothetical protein n=1 Tax=Lelliottia aquatilis TaxID=2080838 RepID=UPI001576EA48|nr:hypothetical protein [Lelliottia aquatilis]